MSKYDGRFMYATVSPSSGNHIGAKPEYVVLFPVRRRAASPDALYANWIKDVQAADPKEQAERSAVRQQALQRILDAGFSKGDVNLADAIGLSRLAVEMQRTQLPLQFDVETAIQTLQTRFTDAFQNFRVNVGVDVAGLEGVLGRDITNPDQFAKGLSEARAEADALRVSLSKIEADRQRATIGLQDFVRALMDTTKGNDASRLGGVILGISPDDAQRGMQLIREFRAEAERLAGSVSITETDVRDLFAKVESLNAIQQTMANIPLMGSGGGFAADIEAMSIATDRLLAVARLPAVDEGQRARLQQLETVIRSTQTASTAIETSLTRGAMALESSLNRAAARLEQAVSRTPVQNFATGGFVSRGTDTVPAMLSPGEFVVNARATQRFYSDLQRLNAGGLVRGTSSVDNSIGDVSITVNEARTPQMTWEAIEDGLMRRQRRGISRLR